MKHFHCFFVALLLGVLGTNAQAVCFKNGVSVSASETGPVVSWSEEFRQAAAVVIGTVLSERDVEDPKERGTTVGALYKLKLESRLKGNVGQTVDVFSTNDSGRVPLAKGKRYLLFLYSQNGRLTADACGNSAKLVYPF
jgi:hypothetical protein